MLNHNTVMHITHYSQCQLINCGLKQEKKRRRGLPITLTINGCEFIIYLAQCPNVDGSRWCFFRHSCNSFFSRSCFHFYNCNFRVHCFRGRFFCSDSCDGLLLVLPFANILFARLFSFDVCVFVCVLGAFSANHKIVDIVA